MRAMLPVLAAVPLVLALAGCGGSDADPDAADDATGGLDERLRLPVYDYTLTVREEERLERARTVLIEECMAELGYDYTHSSGGPADPEVYEEFFGPNDEYRRYGLASRDTAETYAYNIPEELFEEEAAEAEFGHTGDTLADARDALRGARDDITTPSGAPVPDQGCAGQVARELAGTAADAEIVPIATDPVAQDILRDSFTQSLEDPRVTDAIRKWADCMNAEGHDVTDPLEVAAPLGPQTGAAEAEQVEMALADLDCKEETGLLDTWVEVETELQQEMIAAEQDHLDGAAQRFAESLERAAEVLDE